MVHEVEQLSLVISHRRRGPRHRAGTPGLTPYRCRTIDPARPRRAKARHAKRSMGGAQVARVLAAAATLVLLVLSGYRAAEGAAIVLGMF